MTIMHDGIAADALAIKQAFPNDPVALYINSEFAWTIQQEQMFARKIRISNQSGQPAAAKKARCLDVERGAAGPDDVGPFINERHMAGHDDATIYCSISTLAAVLQAVGGTWNPIPRLWVAWWWQRPGYPTRAQVVSEIARLTGLDVPPEKIWSCQFASFPRWDSSIIYGTEDWSR